MIWSARAKKGVPLRHPQKVIVLRVVRRLENELDCEAADKSRVEVIFFQESRIYGARRARCVRRRRNESLVIVTLPIVDIEKSHARTACSIAVVGIGQP